MHADAEAWIAKAEGEYMGAQTLVKKRSGKVAHLTCFAAQQCAEKYLKASLVEHNVPFSKTHDLTKDLLPRCLEIERELSILFPHLEFLDPYALSSGILEKLLRMVKLSSLASCFRQRVDFTSVSLYLRSTLMIVGV